MSCSRAVNSKVWGMPAQGAMTNCLGDCGTDDRAVLLEVFNIINHFQEKNVIN